MSTHRGVHARTQSLLKRHVLDARFKAEVTHLFFGSRHRVVLARDVAARLRTQIGAPVSLVEILEVQHVGTVNKAVVGEYLARSDLVQRVLHDH